MVTDVIIRDDGKTVFYGKWVWLTPWLFISLWSVCGFGASFQTDTGQSCSAVCERGERPGQAQPGDRELEKHSEERL